MTPPLGSTPADREVIRQLAVAAEALELYATLHGAAGYDQAAAEFCRRHTARDVVSGLTVVADYLGDQMVGGREQYRRTLAGWRLAGEVVDAIGPAVDDDSAD